MVDKGGCEKGRKNMKGGGCKIGKKKKAIAQVRRAINVLADEASKRKPVKKRAKGKKMYLRNLPKAVKKKAPVKKKKNKGGCSVGKKKAPGGCKIGKKK